MPTSIRIAAQVNRPFPKGMGTRVNSLVRKHAKMMAEDWQRVTREEAPAREDYPPGYRPGGLRTGIVTKVIDAAVGSAVIEISNKAPYATYVIHGRGPVVAKRAKALRFWAGGAWRFRRSVGPAKANDYMSRGMDRFVRNLFPARMILARTDLLDMLRGQ